jgi:hypothetical protein
MGTTLIDSAPFSFEAGGQAAGFFFQLRFALLRALERIRENPAGYVCLEKLDDISLWSDTNVHEVGQLKHTVQPNQTFSDASPAIWRTLANWTALITTPPFKASGIDFLLITNASVADGSGISMLSADSSLRNETEAIAKLIVAAKESRNTATQADRQTFLAMDDALRAALFRSLTVVPESPSLAALGPEIEHTLHYACESGQLTDFRAELEGWWVQKVATALGAGGATVALVEIDSKVSDLREKYKKSVLAIDVDGDTVPDDRLTDHLFVQQMQIVNASEQRLRNAQRDFLRASTQRSKWIRDLKVDPAELQRYDSELEDQWSAQSAVILDEMSAAASDFDKLKAGRTLLGWAETRQVALRGASAQFLTSGTYHALADGMRVGWHPDYKSLLGPDL